MIKYDIAVIGGGVSGVAAAVSAARTKNLLLAGRCVSASREVLGQIRIMGYCFMMGEAAGITAALAAEHSADTVSVDAKDVQEALLACGIPTV